MASTSFTLAAGLGITLSAMVGFGSLSLWFYTCPALISSPTRIQLRQFRLIFSRGRATIPPLALAGCAAFGYCSWASYLERPAAAQWKLYIIAAVLAEANGPWTTLVMWPGIQELMRRADEAKNSMEEEVALPRCNQSWAQAATTADLVRSFGFLSLPRGLFGILGCIMATFAAVA